MHPYLELHWCMYAHVYTCMLACIQTFGWGPVASIDVTPNFGLEPSEALFDTRHSTVMLQQACCHCHLWSDIIEHYTYMYMSIIYIYTVYIYLFFFLLLLVCELIAPLWKQPQIRRKSQKQESTQTHAPLRTQVRFLFGRADGQSSHNSAVWLVLHGFAREFGVLQAKECRNQYCHRILEGQRCLFQ